MGGMNTITNVVSDCMNGNNKQIGLNQYVRVSVSEPYRIQKQLLFISFIFIAFVSDSEPVRIQ